MTKNLEIVTITTKEVSVTVKIDYKNMKISLVDESYLPKKWLFAERQLDYMQGWKNVLEAMKAAIEHGETCLKLFEKEKDLRVDALLIKASKLKRQKTSKGESIAWK